MKKILMIAAIAVTIVSCQKQRVADDNPSSSSSSSQSTAEDRTVAAPPQAVLNAFAANFGNTPVTQWKLRSDGTWRAHFLKNGVAWEATFKSDGTLVKSEAAK